MPSDEVCFPLGVGARSVVGGSPRDPDEARLGGDGSFEHFPSCAAVYRGSKTSELLIVRRQPLGSGRIAIFPAVRQGQHPARRHHSACTELFCSGSCDATLGGHGQVLSFRTNVDQVVSAGEHHPIRVARDAAANPTPYIMVRDGLEARISRAVYYELVALAVPEVVGGARVIGVWSRNVFFPLGDPEACQAP